ncbi:uncharacterized protein [Typha angustifolia]|uniref:uncharacterized protein isoform X2 n=1 Tax=Typha angustifolia TaxID=59011 RepID=UPI003C2C82EE
MGSDGVRRNEIVHPLLDGFSNGAVSPEREFGNSHSSIVSPLRSSSPSSYSSDVGYIEHQVSKMDTLAGIAIKYGVEIADIRRMNGLVSDLQMFAHKSLQIPLPGRHLPSPVQLNGSARNIRRTPIHSPHKDIVDSFQSLKLKSSPQSISPAMSTLQGYYGLTPQKGDPTKDTEMAVYKTGSLRHAASEPLPRVCPAPHPQHPSRHQILRSPVNRFSLQNGEFSEDELVVEAGSEGEKSKSEISVRRRQKAETDSLLDATDFFEDTGAFPAKIARSQFPRPKSGSRIDMVMGQRESLPNAKDDPLLSDVFTAVRKSSSTSSLAEPEIVSSIWSASKWTLKPEAIKPFFDGIPNPISVWRNKTALD